MKGAPFHANWAAAALEAGRVEDAARLYGMALKQDPAHAEALDGLTRLQMEYRGGEAAFDHFERSAAIRRSPEAWIEWIQALSRNNRFSEAAETGRRALASFPGHAGMIATVAFAAGMSGDAGAALARFESLPEPLLGRKEAMLARAQLALRAGRPAMAAELAEQCSRLDPNAQLPWSMLSVAWRLLGDSREAWLCDYDRLVMICDVSAPDGRLGPKAYANHVAAVLDPLHVTSAAPGNQTLRGGTQTSGALFERPDPAIQEFKQAVLIAAANANAGLPDDPTHPFLRRKSGRLGFSGSWSVRLQDGGFHVQHFHAEGWMSSAYYARLPRSPDREARKRHEGWIQFGVPPANLGVDLEPRRIVEPKPGRLVLFPSYMWHGTIPFRSGDRLTAAFDYVPL
jgi:tetratricopeptide (TPR) repeat protein